MPFKPRLSKLQNVKVHVSHEPMRAIIDPHSDLARNFPGYRVVVHVPFEGEAEVFPPAPGAPSAPV